MLLLDRSSAKLPGIAPRELVGRDQRATGVGLDSRPERTGDDRQRAVGNDVEVWRQLAVDRRSIARSHVEPAAGASVAFGGRIAARSLGSRRGHWSSLRAAA